MSNFYQYFRENMESLGLPAPVSLFGSLQMALANAAAFIAHIDKFGQRITVGEMIGAGLRAEKLGAIATMGAAFYVGAVIGSIAVATGRTLSGGVSLADVMWDIRCNGLYRPWLADTMRRHPVIYDARVIGRSLYQARMTR
ncbi:hypothetical protein [Duganella sp. Root336D2]|uniref:hypothetical protein n=1 Tax=Duganella sp. Root336D2 TaxID=1736518 RepID=UPI0006F6C1B4|nr:hypothetical protein [Duganella sp. Root336D2]KQV44977.1 hypothetical protein ASD07_20485 [Duganella sp. Root336D2]